jgi:hypothetical protein
VFGFNDFYEMLYLKEDPLIIHKEQEDSGDNIKKYRDYPLSGTMSTF